MNLISHICWLLILHLPVYSPAPNHAESSLRFGPNEEYKYGTVPKRKDNRIHHLRGYYTYPPMWKPRTTNVFQFISTLTRPRLSTSTWIRKHTTKTKSKKKNTKKKLRPRSTTIAASPLTISREWWEWWHWWMTRIKNKKPSARPNTKPTASPHAPYTTTLEHEWSASRPTTKTPKSTTTEPITEVTTQTTPTTTTPKSTTRSLTPHKTTRKHAPPATTKKRSLWDVIIGLFD